MSDINDKSELQNLFDLYGSSEIVTPNAVDENLGDAYVDVASPDFERVIVLTDPQPTGKLIEFSMPAPAPQISAIVEKFNGEKITGFFAGGDAEFIEIDSPATRVKIRVSEISLIRFGE